MFICWVSGLYLYLKCFILSSTRVVYHVTNTKVGGLESPQAAMKTPNGFHGNCVLQDLETRCTRADLAPCKVIHLPSACCSPRITCIFLLSSAFQSVASPYREQVVAGSPHHTPRTSCCIFSLPLFKNQTPNISTSMQACAHA